MSGFWRADFHTHTVCSKDGLTGIQSLIDSARRAGLDRVAVTDHNTIRGALEAAALAPDLIVPGEEIQTSEGELLGFYVRKEIPRGLTPEETIARLREQGAAVSVSHPFDRFRRGAWNEITLARIVPLVDALEGFNARCLFAADNRQAAEFARAHGLPLTAGSDAHAALEIGAAGLELPPFHDGSSLGEAFRRARVFGRLSPWWVHLLSQYAKVRKRLK
ncbi:MAG: PHP domain-containing protein [Anaerolineales bacterium]|nr:PHP domain-containing protein [Anaerolineales bacterium]